MDATIVARTLTGFTIRIEVPHHGSMLATQDAIQQAVNRLATALASFDADGKPITTVDGTRLTSEGRSPKDYRIPYGVASVRRHAYQTSRGGRTFSPLDAAARIVVSSTPRFAKVVAHK